MRRVIAIIQCESAPSWERLLERHEDRSMLEGLAGRLREVQGLGAIYLFVERPDRRRALVEEARRLGLRVLHRDLSNLGTWVRLGLHGLTADAVVRVKEETLFMDPGIADRMVETLQAGAADCVGAEGFPKGLAPSQAFAPRFLARRMLENLPLLAGGRELAKGMRQALLSGRTARVTMEGWGPIAAKPPSFVVDSPEDLTVLTELFQDLDLWRFRLSDVLRRYANEDRLIEHLVRARERSAYPHVVNAMLNRYEAEWGRSRLQSFPVSVALNIMPICDVDCKFCSFTPQEMDDRTGLTLEQFKRLDWIQYATELALWGGIGESLINREFLNIFNYACERFPHLKVGLSTIGKSLKPHVSDHLVGRLSFLNVSLNAARRETHERIVKAGQFDRVVANLRYLMERRRASGTTRPRVHLSMVMMRENMEEMPEFVDLAADLGVDLAVFSHYLDTTIEGRRKASEDSSLYRHQARADEVFTETSARARQRDLAISLPPLFSKLDCSVFFSSRSEFGPSGDCHSPWNNCFLTLDERGHRQLLFCCSGMYLRVPYDIDRLDREHFMQLWNGPVPRHFRETTNAAEGNPLCSFCKTEDRFDPSNRKIFDIDRTFGKTLEALSGEEALIPVSSIDKAVSRR